MTELRAQMDECASLAARFASEIVPGPAGEFWANEARRLGVAFVTLDAIVSESFARDHDRADA